MADVFISYASADRALVCALAEALGNAGLDLWWDRELLGGERFEKAIEREIRAARCVLVVWTPASVDSDWVRSEAMHGFDRGVLLPVVVDGAQAPLPFSTLNCVRLPGQGPDAADPEFERLLASLRAIVSGEQRMGLRHQAEQAPQEPQASLAVLPLRAMTGQPEDQALGIGIAFALGTALARVPELFVIDSNSTLALADSPKGARQVAEELAVRYLVQGTLLRMGPQLRVMVELVEAVTGRQIWSDTVDAAQTMDDLFALQDEVCRSIAARLSPRLQAAELERAMRKPTAELAAWQLVNQARQLRVRRDDRERLALLDRAIAMDPDYVEALALRARYLSFRIVMGDRSVVDEVLGILDHALGVDPDNEYALVVAGECHYYLRHFDRAVAYCERALELNPNVTYAWAFLGLCVLGQTQDAERAMGFIQRAFELSPRDDSAWLWHHELASCHLQRRDFAEAVRCSRKSVQAWD